LQLTAGPTPSTDRHSSPQEEASTSCLIPYGFIRDDARIQNPGAKWVFANTASDNLLLLFLFLTVAASNIEGSWLNPLPYVANMNVHGIQFER
jgi:hypothetical protein